MQVNQKRSGLFQLLEDTCNCTAKVATKKRIWLYCQDDPERKNITKTELDLAVNDNSNNSFAFPSFLTESSTVMDT